MGPTSGKRVSAIAICSPISTPQAPPRLHPHSSPYLQQKFPFCDQHDVLLLDSNLVKFKISVTVFFELVFSLYNFFDPWHCSLL